MSDRVVIDLLGDDEEEEPRRRKRHRSSAASGGAPPSNVIALSDDDEPAPPAAAVAASSSSSSAAAAAAGSSSSSSGPGLGEYARPSKEITCPICFCETPPHEAVKLSGSCGHDFCVECLTTFVREKVKVGEVLGENLSCPCVEPTRCAVALTPQDVKRCLETPADIERYDRLALQRCVEAEDGLGACPTSGCPFVFAWEEDNRKLECPLCVKSFCLVCRCEPWHRGVRCEQFQAERGDPDASEAAFAAFAKNQKLRQCPKCKFFVEKSSGCDAMHCRCNLVFCYKCGGVLKQNAKQGTGLNECRCGHDDILRAHEGAPQGLQGVARAIC